MTAEEAVFVPSAPHELLYMARSRSTFDLSFSATGTTLWQVHRRENQEDSKLKEAGLSMTCFRFGTSSIISLIFVNKAGLE